MVKDAFDRFINFGSIGDKKSREQIANAIYSQLQKKSEKGIGFTNVDSDNFATAIDEILSNLTMKELCSKDPELAEKITYEILHFINKTNRTIGKSENPIGDEYLVFKEFEQSKKSEFKNKWEKVVETIKDMYFQKEIDLNFYEKEFRSCLDDKTKSDKEKPSFESVQAHFLEKWNDLLFQKQTKWELEIIDKERKKFCEELYKRIEELKKLQEALEPFTQELGRLWDMSKGNWQRVNLDIIKRYVELLQRDKSLKELAEMLGKMRQAEQEFEEELFANIQLKPEWKVEHANKADLIGIHESDDLSSLLPSETALLADETMQSVFFKKFAEKKLQTFNYQAKMLSYRDEEHQAKRQTEKEEAKGPFIICVDTSGSMHGTPETVAKTLCFAILKIAIRDNRKCYLISFSTGIETLNLTDLKNSLDKIISFLSMSFHGGTDATPAMREAIRMLTTEDYKKADVIMVSDFVMSAFDKATQNQIKSAKDNKTKFHSLVVGNSQNSAAIEDFDSNWFYDLNNPNSVLTLITNINEI
jgi:uncharacterized protein with von Willebrand factor type A (vWA) domain